MLPENQPLVELLAVLADLFPDANDCRDIALQAGIKPETFDSTGKAIHIWQSLLEEARKQARLRAVFEVTRARYPNDPRLPHAWASYLATMASPATPAGQPPPKPGQEPQPPKEGHPSSGKARPKKRAGTPPARRRPFSWLLFLLSGAAGIGLFFLLFFFLGTCTGCIYQQLPETFQLILLAASGSLIAAAGGDLYRRKRSNETLRQDRIFDALEIFCMGFLLPAGLFLIIWARTDGSQYVAMQCTATPTATATPAALPTLTFTPTPTPTLTPTPTEPPPPLSLCAYPPGADQEALQWLVQAEARAASQKDLALIQVIFAPDAAIWDAVNGGHWTSPLERYEPFFNDVQTIEASHADLQAAGPGIQAGLGWLTSSSTTTIDGGAPYVNPPLSDHWTFAKAQNGCWVITGLVFNASHIPFPCACQGADDEALRCLINAEAETVKSENLLLASLIYLPEASIYEGETLKSSDPLEYYQKQLFDLLDFTDPQHVDITPLEVAAQQAWYTSGSRGAYAPPGSQPTPYANDNPSEHWTFGRTPAGCWAIARFAFNAKHVPFPP